MPMAFLHRKRMSKKLSVSALMGPPLMAPACPRIASETSSFAVRVVLARWTKHRPFKVRSEAAFTFVGTGMSSVGFMAIFLFKVP